MNDIQTKFSSKLPAQAIPEFRSQAEIVTTSSLSSLNNPKLEKFKNLAKKQKNETQAQESIIAIQEGSSQEASFEPGQLVTVRISTL